MKILHLSDTHNCHHRLRDLPEADVVVHSGDYAIIPDDTDVLITHSPAFGILGFDDGINYGSEEFDPRHRCRGFYIVLVAVSLFQNT